MNYIIIRTCPKDDHLSRLCYESFKRANMQGDYRFFAAHGDYKWLPAGVPVYKHMECANFGGQRGAVILMRHLKRIYKKMQPGDFVFVADADIILRQNIEWFAETGCDMGGIFGYGPDTITATGEKFGMQHISGQLMIFSAMGLAYGLKNYRCGVAGEVERMIDTYPGIGIADDTYLSAQVPDHLKYNFTPHKAWQHIKAYYYEGRTDWANMIKEVIANN